MNPRLTLMWKWALMPIATIFGSLLAAALMGLFQWFSMKFFTGGNEDGWWFRYILPIITAGTWGYSYGWIAYTYSPNGKIIGATVMTTLLVTFTSYGTYLAWSLSRYSTGQAIQATTGTIATITASIIAIANLHENHTKSDPVASS